MANATRHAAGAPDDAVASEILTVAEARIRLPTVLKHFRLDPEAEPVLVGSHRKADAAIVPIRQYRTLCTGQATASLGVLDFLIQRMRLVKKLANINRIESVAVFGSVARGEERADSDVDLLVRPNPEASLFDLAQFAEDMEELLGHPVDVVSRRGLDSVRDRNILSEALEL
jgi:uncharacterized protein